MTYDHAPGSLGSDRKQVADIMDFFIGLVLIFFGAPLVGLIGRWIEGAGREGLGKTISVGGYLLVLGIAAWLIIGSF